jgi:hypothetical protein
VNGFDVFGVAVNTGTGCATQVAGVTTLTNVEPPHLTLELPWSLPATRIIQPGERFEIYMGAMTDAQAFRFPRGTYTSRFTFVSIACS